MRVAIVHDWLSSFGGAEKVLAEMLALYPQADLYSVIDFLSDADREKLGGRRAFTSFIQSLPFAQKAYRSYLPLMPLAIEQLDLSGYDLVLSSSHAVAKGVITGPDQVHVSYVHSPMRYAWDLQHQYLKESGLERGMKGWLVRAMLHRIRMWDVRTANGVDCFIANSAFIARRIRKVYGRSAEVVYPPVAVHEFAVGTDREDFFVTASRLVPYKRVDAIVAAFSRLPESRLVVIGDGPDYQKLRRIAPSNVEFLGHVSHAVLMARLQAARAFIFAAEEDFGISPVEAQACGTPVIAYAKGGALETVVGSGPWATGAFFFSQTGEAIARAIEDFSANADSVMPEACRRNAERFSTSSFRARFSVVVDRAIANAGMRDRPGAV